MPDENSNLKIGQCTKLAILKASGCKFGDVALMNVLQNCGTGLQILEVRNNTLSDLTVCLISEGLQALRSLNLEGNEI